MALAVLFDGPAQGDCLGSIQDVLLGEDGQFCAGVVRVSRRVDCAVALLLEARERPLRVSVCRCCRVYFRIEVGEL